MIVATITGHRPGRIENWPAVRQALGEAYFDLKVDMIIQGMAAGVDLESARVAYDTGITFCCAIPWAGHEPRVADKIAYAQALKYSYLTWTVNDCEGYPGPQVYQERNEFMVDRGHIVIAVWDGLKKGGTWNCIKYAIQKDRPIWRIDPRDGASDWYGYDPKIIQK